MAIGVALNSSSIALEEEVTEGTYVAPAAGASFIEVLEDGLDFTPGKELISRNNLTDSLELVAARTGQRSVSGTIGVELKADGTEGDPPETDLLYKNCLGGKRTAVTAATTTGNTSTVLTFASHPFLVGDSLLIKETGAFEMRPVQAITGTTVTLEFALLNGAPSDGVSVAALTTYFIDGENAATISATRYIGGEVEERNIGLRCVSASLENFTTGSVANVNFSLEGLDFVRLDGAPGFTPAFDAAEPPIILNACIFINGTQLDMNNFSWSIENEIGFITSTCSENGKIASRFTKQTVTGSMDPYLDDADDDFGGGDSLFDIFKQNDNISIFGYALNASVGATQNSTTLAPTAFEDIAAFWIPQAKITEDSVGDAEGIATNEISWQSHREDGNDSIFLSFI